MGFVIVEGQETDILVRPSDFNTAMHGDTVRVRLKDEKRTELAVARDRVRILKDRLSL